MKYIFNFTVLFVLFFSQAIYAKPTHHLFGIERGLMDGLALHVAPWKLDFALSYGNLPFTVSDRSAGQAINYSANTKIEQTAVRVGIYTERYGIDSFYFSSLTGSWKIEETRSGDALGSRTGKSSGDIITLFSVGVHFFWDSFNLRLGLAAGSSAFSDMQFKNSVGTVVETDSPLSLDYSSLGGLDLAIGWAF